MQAPRTKEHVSRGACADWLGGSPSCLKGDTERSIVLSISRNKGCTTRPAGWPAEPGTQPAEPLWDTITLATHEQQTLCPSKEISNKKQWGSCGWSPQARGQGTNGGVPQEMGSQASLRRGQQQTHWAKGSLERSRGMLSGPTKRIPARFEPVGTNLAGYTQAWGKPVGSAFFFCVFGSQDYRGGGQESIPFLI